MYLFVDTRLVSLAGDWEWDMNTDQLFCSDVIINSLEFDQLPGTQSIIFPDDKNTLLNELLTAEKGQICNFNFRVITTYGVVKWLKCKGVVEFIDESNKPLSFLENELKGYIIKKRTEEKLNSFEWQVRSYMFAETTLAAGIWYMNTATMEVFYSDQVYHIYGLPAQSLNAHYHTFSSFLHPVDKLVVTDTLDRAFRDQLPVELEYRILLKDQSVKYVNHITRWFRNVQGQLMLAGVLKDITATKEAEQELMMLQDELKIKEEMTSIRDRNNNIGNWYINLVTRKMFFSESILRIYGIKQRSEMMSLGFMSTSIHPDDQRKMTEVTRRIYQDAQPPDAEFRIIRKDGKIRYLHQVGRIIINAQQEKVMVGIIEDITERVINLRLITENKTRIQLQSFSHAQAEEMAKMGSWMWDVKTGEIVWSDGLYHLLGRKPASVHLTQKSLLPFIHPEDRKIFTEYISSMITQGVNSNFDFRIIRNGDIRYVKAIFKLIHTEAKIMFVGIVQDITEEKLLDKQLSDQAILSELVSDAIVDRIFVTDVNNYIIKWNKACELAYHVEKSKAIGKNLFDVMPPLKTTEILGLYQKVLEGETISYADRKDLFRKGYNDLLMVPIKDDDHGVIAVLTILHDTTKEFELRLQLTERLLFIEKLLAASIDRIIVMDEYMNYIYWNDKAEQYYGLTKEQVLGKNVLEIFPGFINEPFYGEFRSALRGETIHIPPKESDGSYFEAYLIPLKNEVQKVTGVLWIVHDLSKEYHLDIQQKKAIEILDVLNENYFELDKQYRFIHINQKSELYFGKSAGEIYGKVIWEVFPAIWNTPVQDAIKTVLEQNIPVTGEYLFPVSNHWVYLSMAVTKDGMMGVFIDIQNLKKAEEEIKENQHFIQQIANSTPDVITVFDLENNSGIYMNRTIGNMLGYTVEELTAMGYEGRLAKIIFPDDRNKLLVFNEKLKNAGDNEIRMLEYRVVSKDGTIRWIKNRGKPFKRSDQGEVTHVINILQDITDEVKLRMQLEERTKFIQALIDANLDRIIVVDRELRIIEWNKRCEDLYGVSKQSAMGHILTDVLPRMLEDSFFEEGMRKAFSGSYVHLQAKRDLYLDLYNETYLIPLFDEKKEVYATLKILHDVTGIYDAREKLKKLNVSLEQKNILLAQKNDEITTFAFVASHDLKEPLRKIQTFSDWLTTNELEKLSDSGKSYVQKLTSAVKLMEELIEDILALTRIHAESREFVDTDLNTVLQNVLADLSSVIGQKGAIIHSEHLPVIYANPNQLFYLFKNLIGNALKFQSKEHAPVVEITCNMVEGKNMDQGDEDKLYVRISFIDNGIGLDMKYSKKIFQVFQRLHTKGEYEGTGMGLAICKKVMENHDGFISVESEENKGAVFHCFFPAYHP